jgi:hypothetical protein
MGTAIDRILEEALRMSPQQRAQLVGELLATLEPDTLIHRRSEAEWIEEVERRAARRCTGRYSRNTLGGGGGVVCSQTAWARGEGGVGR